MLKALLWDVDGTLADTERDGHRVAFNLAFAELGLPWGWCERRYGELLEVTGGRERLLADMATRSDAPPDPQERDQLARRLHAVKNREYARLVAEGRVRARPGVLRLIEQARAVGLRQAIVTTTSRVNVEALMPTLLGARWGEDFAAVVCGEDVARKKPDPQAYERALTLLGLAPGEAVAIEDSAPGAAAAQAAGVPVLLARSAYFAAVDVPGVLWSGPDLTALPDAVAASGGSSPLAAVRALHARR